ncbi:MAG TPA: TetR/AcrR family transcriptional regulator [Nocardioides sp.]|uniref:TetR/AcrR family transcriptional regulator n=1 Tax=uncultured Nocardioides sp. TaxID=198441 RepID=UPI002615E0F4|nr:TetR/AcrR family transcriptional regulator [uncultured Nocardioides sp.]HRD61021.1 TetR/AcrR family transcriptional regulator [Nocardioides sp.]HRI94928.1 TetR/AcrR family transcriptional regulator [Nocardioides sp.]HRK44968.1 TetR/AcrR family transcriptional regulator [Nocardioides sp.]
MSPRVATSAKARSAHAGKPSTKKSAKAGPAWEDYSTEAELDAVLVHSLEAFVESGYHATSVRDLARRLGQTVPAIYYHYENKQALLVALLSYSIEDLLKRAKAAEAESPDDPKRRFELLVRCMVLFTAHRRELAFLDAEIRSLEPANRKAYVAMRDDLEAMVTNAVEEGMRTKVFTKGDAHAVARATITMVRGIANWYRTDGELDPDSLAKLYVMFALRLAGAH